MNRRELLRGTAALMPVATAGQPLSLRDQVLGAWRIRDAETVNVTSGESRPWLGRPRTYSGMIVYMPKGASSKAGADYTNLLNLHSLDTVRYGIVEPMLGHAMAGARFQFERFGCFCADPDSSPGCPVFHRTFSSKDTWAKIAAHT